MTWITAGAPSGMRMAQESSITWWGLMNVIAFFGGLYAAWRRHEPLSLLIACCLPIHTARKRWVIYAEKRTNAYNPTTIPPEWHAWINYINDYPPTTVSSKCSSCGL